MPTSSHQTDPTSDDVLHKTTTDRPPETHSASPNSVKMYKRTLFSASKLIQRTNLRTFSTCARRFARKDSGFDKNGSQSGRGWAAAGAAAGAVGVVGYVVGRHWELSVTPVGVPECEEKEKSEKRSEKWQHRRRRCRFEGDDLRRAVRESRDMAQRIKDEVGSPGLIISVSVDGKEVWSEGLGYADVENRLPCTPETVMRIASISKPITMAVVAKLWEAGQLDLDRPVGEYVPSWPKKEFKGEPVTITTRQLVSHLSGIRHYDKTCKKKKSANDKKEENNKKDNKNQQNEKKDDKSTKDEVNQEKKKKQKSEFELAEYHIKRHFESVTDSITLFKDDCLCSKPGTEFLYSTHGFSLIGAVIEGASGHKLPILLKGLFKDLGLQYTYLDDNEPIVYHRARCYQKNDRGRLVNARYVDCSYKYAGGGLLSTVTDLNKFGNAMLYSYQHTSNTNGPNPGSNPTPKSPGDPKHSLSITSDSGSPSETSSEPTSTSPLDSKNTPSTPAPASDTLTPSPGEPALPGYLQQKTLQAMWSPVANTECSWDSDGAYGMSWAVIPGAIRHGACRDQRFYVSHTGGAVGASSVLLVLPRKPDQTAGRVSKAGPPQGVVVSMIVNLQSVGLNKVALEIAKKFEKLDL